MLILLAAVAHGTSSPRWDLSAVLTARESRRARDRVPSKALGRVCEPRSLCSPKLRLTDAITELKISFVHTADSSLDELRRRFARCVEARCGGGEEAPLQAPLAAVAEGSPAPVSPSPLARDVSVSASATNTPQGGGALFASARRDRTEARERCSGARRLRVHGGTEILPRGCGE